MTAPTIRLATPEDFCSITSKNVEDILRLPHLYISTGEPDVMRAWGVAGTPGFNCENSVVETERLYPGALVAPCFCEKTASRADLRYNGAEPASDFLRAS